MPDVWDQFPDAPRDAWADFPDAPGNTMSAAKSELSKLSAGLRPQVSQGRAALEGALSGTGFGLRDEALAASRASGLPEWMGGFRAPIGAARLAYEGLTEPGTASETYGKTLTDIREVQKSAQEQYPKTYLGSEIAGAVAVPIGSGVNTLRGGARLGAGLGALYGAGSGEGIEGRLTGAALGGVGGAATGAAGQAIINRLAARSAAAATKPGAQAVQSAERLGVYIPRGVASDRPSVQAVTQGLRQSPVAGGTITRSIEGTTEQLGGALGDIESQLGSGNVVSAGTTAADAIEKWITKGSKAHLEKLYGDVDKAVNPNILTPLANTRAIAGQIASELAAAKLPESKAVSVILDAATDPSGLPYQAIKTARSAIGEAMNGKIIPEGMSQSQLKRLYGSLTKDLETSIANSAGNAGLNLWKKANASASRVAESRDALAKIIGTKADAPAEAVIDRIAAFASTSSRADVARLAKAKGAIGDSWDEVSSAVLHRLGRDPSGNFTADRFVTAWGKELSPNGKRLLFSPEHRAALEDIATVARQLKATGALANRSNTARGYFTQALVGAPGAAAGYTSGGGQIDPSTLIGTMVGGFVAPLGLAALLSRPAGARLTARYLSSVNAAIKSGSSTALQRAQRVFADDVGNLIQQGTVTVRSYQDQGDRERRPN